MRDDNDPPPLIDLSDVPTDDEPAMNDIEPIRDVLPRDHALHTDNQSNIIYDDDNSSLTSDDVGNANDTEVTAAVPEQSVDVSIPTGVRRSPRLAGNVMVVSGNMSVAKAIRLHGGTAEAAVRSELAQMLSKNVFEMVMPADINGRDVIHSHMLLKKNEINLANWLKSWRGWLQVVTRWIVVCTRKRNVRHPQYTWKVSSCCWL